MNLVNYNRAELFRIHKGTHVVFEETIWMTIFSTCCLSILTYSMIGMFFYNFLVALPSPQSEKLLSQPSTPALKDGKEDGKVSKLGPKKRKQKGGPLSQILSEKLTTDFRTLRHKQLRALFLRLMLPPKATAGIKLHRLAKARIL